MGGNSMSTLQQGVYSLLRMCFQHTDVKKGLPRTNTTCTGEQFSRSLFLRFSCSEQRCCSMLHPPCWVGKPKFLVTQVHLCK